MIKLRYVYWVSKSGKKMYLSFRNAYSPLHGLIDPYFTSDETKKLPIHAWDIEYIKVLKPKIYNILKSLNCITIDCSLNIANK